jgi:acyl-CoA synthetase (NDP forming)
VKDTGVRVIGPNCLGFINTDPDHSLNATFGLPQSPVGNVAVGTQSGALGFVFPESMRQWRVGISQMVSVGNKFDVAENDLIEHWEHDDRARVIQLYLESFQDPRRFLETARRISRSKPIVAIKAGRETGGMRAAGSHTAALASPAAAADGLFRQSGVIVVDSSPNCSRPRRCYAYCGHRRVAVLTNAGILGCQRRRTGGERSDAARVLRPATGAAP